MQGDKGRTGVVVILAVADVAAVAVEVVLVARVEEELP